MIKKCLLEARLGRKTATEVFSHHQTHTIKAVNSAGWLSFKALLDTDS